LCKSCIEIARFWLRHDCDLQRQLKDGARRNRNGHRTLTVQINYMQSATAAATITESAAPGTSGGGTLDLWTLPVVIGLVLVQWNRHERGLAGEFPAARLRW
jgi:hypothetical protein